MSNAYIARQRLALCAYLAICALEPRYCKLIHVQWFDFLDVAVEVTAVYQEADLIENQPK